MKQTTIKALKKTRRVLVQEIKEILPHGYKRDIAKRAGVSYTTVVRFFNGVDNRKLYSVVTEYLQDYIDETRKLASTVDVKINDNDRVYVDHVFLVGLGVKSSDIITGTDRNIKGIIKTWRSIVNPIDEKNILIDYDTIPKEIISKYKLPRKTELEEDNKLIYVIPENY